MTITKMYAAGKSLAEIFAMGVTASEWNSWERMRSSLLARLRGLREYEEGDTFESLKAAYEAHVGGAYETEEQEAQRQWEKGRAARDAKYKAACDAERQILADAADNGFLGLCDIVEFWGWPRRQWQAALKRTEMAGEPIVTLIPDGHSVAKIPITQRKGLYPDGLERVTVAKDKWYEDIRVEQARRNAEVEAEAERIQREHQADLDARAEAYRSQQAERLKAVEERNRIRAEEREARLHELMNTPEMTEEERRSRIVSGLASFTGPFNKKGRPKMRPLRAHLVTNHGLAGVKAVTLQERNELWALRDHPHGA